MSLASRLDLVGKLEGCDPALANEACAVLGGLGNTCGILLPPGVVKLAREYIGPCQNYPENTVGRALQAGEEATAKEFTLQLFRTHSVNWATGAGLAHLIIREGIADLYCSGEYLSFLDKLSTHLFKLVASNSWKIEHNEYRLVFTVDELHPDNLTDSTLNAWELYRGRAILKANSGVDRSSRGPYQMVQYAARTKAEAPKRNAPDEVEQVQSDIHAEYFNVEKQRDVTTFMDTLKDRTLLGLIDRAEKFNKNASQSIPELSQLIQSLLEKGRKQIHEKLSPSKEKTGTPSYLAMIRS